MRAQLLHLSGPLRGHTDTYAEPRVVIGSAPDAAARIAAPGVAARHALLRFDEPGCSFHLRRLGGQVFVNNREVEEVILQHGDLIELGADGPKLRFRVYTPPGAVCKPVRQMLGDARDVQRSSGLAASTGSLVRDLLTHATLQLKVGVPLVLLLLLLPLAYLAGWFGGGRSARVRENAQSVAELRKQLEALEALRREQLSRAEVDALREEFARRNAALERLTRTEAALKRVLDEYSRGVCLVHGIYGFAQQQGDSFAYLYGTDGQRIQVEYLGSGFLAAHGATEGEGIVVTNRHVAEPWWHDKEVQPILQLGWQPRFLTLRVTFPGNGPRPVDPTTVRLRNDDIDVATFSIDLGGLAVPILPLYTGDPAVLRGEHVVVLGYPTGINALLARVDATTYQEVTANATDLTSVIDALASRSAIAPLATQGALNDVLAHRLVFDAETTSGGSGGPIFGAEGLVVGISFGVLKGFGGSNFGVPIRYARELLP